MGGSGGSSYSSRENKADELRAEARKKLQQQEVVANKNEFLGELLAEYNDRPYDEVRERLENIEERLGADDYEVDRLLYGGSVAKHTYVDGLSDVDSLVFINEELAGSPSEVLREFQQRLTAELPAGQVQSIEHGNMAVTITYSDGAQIQILPAIERNGHTVIPSPDGADWKSVRPHKFTEKLTEVNQRANGGVVPAIKLAKGLIGKLPERLQLSGYHIEAIAVDAFKGYSGATDRASMVQHLMDHATSAVRRPTSDITGQSVRIDDHLGPANSDHRGSISRALGTIGRALRNATSAEAYKQVFE